MYSRCNIFRPRCYSILPGLWWFTLSVSIPKWCDCKRRRNGGSSAINERAQLKRPYICSTKRPEPVGRSGSARKSCPNYLRQTDGAETFGTSTILSTCFQDEKIALERAGSRRFPFARPYPLQRIHGATRRRIRGARPYAPIRKHGFPALAYFPRQHVAWPFRCHGHHGQTQ